MVGATGPFLRGMPSPAPAGRVCLVTGASHGIGRQIAADLAARGDTVVLVARPSAALDEATAAAGDRAVARPCDVADAGAVADLVAEVEQTYGRVDVLVTAAAVEGFTHVVDTAVDELRRTVETNLLGTVYAVRAVLPGMLARGAGAIATFASSSGDFPQPGGAAYAASKAGVQAFTEALWAELDGTAVHAFWVAPGFVPGTKMSTEHAAVIGRPPRFVARDVRAVSAAVIRELDGTKVRLVLPKVLSWSPLAPVLFPRLALRATARAQK